MKWPLVRLGDVAEVVGGSTPSRDREEYWNGHIPWLTPTDLPMPGEGIAVVSSTRERITDAGLSAISASLLPPGTVLFSSRATIGKIGIAAAPLATNQGFANLVPSKAVFSKFLAYSLLYYREEISRLAGSTTFKEVRRGALKRFQIPLPPLSEQRRIVEILDQADALRKKRAEADAKAARILPALFCKMFGDPATNPKGWPMKALSALGASVRYGLGQPPTFSPAGVPFIRATNISRGRIEAQDVLTVDPKSVPSGRDAFLRVGEVIVVRSGAYTGDVAQVTDRWSGSVIGYDLVVSPGPRLTGEFLEAYLLSPAIQNGYFANAKARAGQPHLNAEQLAATLVFDIPSDLQAYFAKCVQTYRGTRDEYLQSERKLNALFCTLLHRAFTGDLTARWREAHMKELLAEMESQAKELEAVR